jgi:hypothetical protein
MHTENSSHDYLTLRERSRALVAHAFDVAPHRMDGIMYLLVPVAVQAEDDSEYFDKEP